MASTRSKKSTPVDNPAPADALSSNRQQTISQLFTSSHRHSAEACADLALAHGSKRRKLSPPTNGDGNPISPSKPASVENMYTFSSARPAAAGATVVDLTSSPTASPNSKSRKLSVGAKIENAPAPGGPKKLAVKNFRTTAKSDSNEYCNRTISQLDAALSSIFANQRPALSNEELYRGVENVCKLGKASDLSKILIGRCKDHVANDLRAPLLHLSERKPVDVLAGVIEAWSLWLKQLTTIRPIFFYLDRSHLIHQGLSIYDSAVQQFRSYIFGDPLFRGKIIDGACDLLLDSRTGQSSEQGLFISAVKMFHDLQVYTAEFEPHMLDLSQTYIAAWSEKQCSERELSDYVVAAVDLMDAEMKRCEMFNLDQTTRRALLTLLEHHLIERRESELTNQDSVADLLDKSEVESTAALASLFLLLERRHLGGKLKTAFATWIDDTGTAIVFDEKQQDKMIIRLLELKQKLDNLWRFSFQKNEELGHALRNAFEVFLNKSKKSSATWDTDNAKPGEMIAKYVDMLLKAGAKAIPSSLKGTSSRVTKPMDLDEELDENEDIDEDTEVDNQLDQVLDLFRFLHGKAVFEAFYKKDLARRLLMGRSASNDAEKNMLARLKTECGAGFTQNLEQMFKDIELAEEEAKAYRQRMENNDRKAAIDLSVNILSAAAWPSYPDVPVTIPPDVKKTIENFENFYYMKHSGRKLLWKHALAHCQMKADFPKGKKDLVVSSFQAIVLLLFNGVGLDEHLSYEHIKAESGLSEAEIKRTLQSLACAKLRPLTKHPRGRDINDTDTFTINSNFSHEKYRVKINAIQLKETKEENKETHVRVAADRQFETQAAIVRIMKQKKTIGHAQLVGEVINATKSRGTLQPNDIKRNIDKLIEKEYMERAENNTYNYLA